MEIEIKQYKTTDNKEAIEIWNEVVEAGVAFPQLETLDEKSGDEFFKSQSFTAIARDTDTGEAVGLYILHPNNVGRCGHICNASYAVSSEFRGRRIGEALVRDCMEAAKELGFRVLQFNAVVAVNVRARRLYERLGFRQLGTIPGGFRLDNGEFADICPYFIEL